MNSSCELTCCRKALLTDFQVSPERAQESFSSSSALITILQRVTSQTFVTMLSFLTAITEGADNHIAQSLLLVPCVDLLKNFLQHNAPKHR